LRARSRIFKGLYCRTRDSRHAAGIPQQGFEREQEMFEIAQPGAGIHGSSRRFPVHRIYCVGRNYAAHARESGADPDREAPFYFMKPADAIMPNGSRIPYPPRTRDLHHEIELVVAIATGGSNIPVAD